MVKFFCDCVIVQFYKLFCKLTLARPVRFWAKTQNPKLIDPKLFWAKLFDPKPSKTWFFENWFFKFFCLSEVARISKTLWKIAAPRRRGEYKQNKTEWRGKTGESFQHMEVVVLPSKSYALESCCQWVLSGKFMIFWVLGGFGFWPKTSGKSFGFGQNSKNPRKRQV